MEAGEVVDAKQGLLGVCQDPGGREEDLLAALQVTVGNEA